MVIEKAGGFYSAYATDLPNCVATGATAKEAEREIAGAIRFHLVGMEAEGLAAPEPAASVEYVAA